jgi:rSAM/selenodomain-associated transferase 2/rSAM/selenodomain-associated transferase 1
MTSAASRMPASPRLGVVIPTLNEADTLPALLHDLRRLPGPATVVVADGGSSDGTRRLAASQGVRVVEAPRGRATQMNVGAAALSTPWILFLHADCRMPQDAREALFRFLEDPSPAHAAHFRFRLDAAGLAWRLIEWGQHLRERLTGMAYGDQGLLLHRSRWEAMGGIPEVTIMEDVEAVRRLRRSGGITTLDAPLLTSPRRYREEGLLRAWVRNAILVTLYRLGTDPDRLAHWYPPRNGGRRGRGAPGGGSGPGVPSSRATLIVFAKAPRPGQVKTRLAATLGHEEAARLYRRMGRRIVNGLRSGPFRTVVHFAPAAAEAELKGWLGEEGLEFRPQVAGDLGTRMAAAFDEAFRRSERVCIVGTDAPGLNRTRVNTALSLLDDPPGADAVFGPALDGGYYLLALRRPAPELFRNIPWSTSSVLELSLARAAESDLRVRMLDVLNDVDHPEDIPSHLLTHPTTATVKTPTGAPLPR